MTRPGVPLSDLLGRAVTHVLHSGPAAASADAYILDAAVRVLRRRGTREATMDDIAAEAGVGRATLFRRFGGKDQLFEQALIHEFSRLRSDLAHRFETVTDPVEQVAEGFTSCLQLTHRLLPGDADPRSRTEFLTALGHGDPSLISLSHKALRTRIRVGQDAGTLPPGDADAQADALIHATIGYIVTPSLSADLRDPAAARTLARTALAPILTGSGRSALHRNR